MQLEDPYEEAKTCEDCKMEVAKPTVVKQDMRKKGDHKGVAGDSGRHEHGSGFQEKSEGEVAEKASSDRPKRRMACGHNMKPRKRGLNSCRVWRTSWHRARKIRTSSAQRTNRPDVRLRSCRMNWWTMGRNISRIITKRGGFGGGLGVGYQGVASRRRS